jgi:hypothetical protein
LLGLVVGQREGSAAARLVAGGSSVQKGGGGSGGWGFEWGVQCAKVAIILARIWGHTCTFLQCSTH